ncbi:MAG: 16S rRNA (guanine(966)-N(2))-methyltransferase RsmD [Chloroflexota bacterium]|jgi:16S rRNA (guanine966-N2)-methyltransferase|nr:16S rRNA (guanine(966)-N(2))-methyltransferase RsmD [Chloroflexota bacterium]
MRVITGKAKGHKLQMVPGDSTRPITDRAKEALFSILGDWVIGARVLDLFAGTGAVGIEALSRGSSFALFLDRNRRAVDTINANLRHCRLRDQARVEQADSFAFLHEYRGEPFDLVYIAPPQYQDLWRKALEQIDRSPRLLAPFATVIAQIHPREDAPLDLAYLQEYDRRRYGSVLLIFYASRAALEAEEAGDDWEAEETAEEIGEEAEQAEEAGPDAP